MKTRRGIYWDLKESNITYNVEGLILYFSSNFNKLRFEKDYQNYIITESNKLFNKYLVPFNFNLFLIMSFYRKIEKRGFRVEVNGKDIYFNDIIVSRFLRS